MKQPTIKEMLEWTNRTIGEIGIHGILAMIHDNFNVNFQAYESYPEIQKCLVQIDCSMKIRCDEVLTKEDIQVDEQGGGAYRMDYHGIEPLYKREVSDKTAEIPALHDYRAQHGAGIMLWNSPLGYKIHVCVDGICVLRVLAPEVQQDIESS